MQNATQPLIIDAKFLEDFLPPCSQIQTIAYTSKHLKRVDERKLSTKDGTKVGPSHSNKRTTDIIFKYPYYKENQYIKAFDTESFVGNTGGYIGMVLGWAFWQLPDFIEYLLSKISILKRFCK